MSAYDSQVTCDPQLFADDYEISIAGLCADDLTIKSMTGPATLQ